MIQGPRLASLAFLASLVLAQGAAAATFTVTDVDPDAPGGLRTILDAAPKPGPHRIVFDIPGPGPHVITVINSPLVISNDLEIDGYSQPGSRPNGSPTGFDADLRIAIKTFSLFLEPQPLVVAEGNVTFRGIEFLEWYSGVETPSTFDGQLTITGCRLQSYLSLFGGGSVQIGGPAMTDRNHFYAAPVVNLFSGDNVTIEGNLFEANAAATRGFDYHVINAETPLPGAEWTIRDNQFLGLAGTAIFATARPGFDGPTIVGNRFVANSSLAIDISPEGPTPNDPGDGLLPVNAPLLTGRQLTATRGLIAGRLEGAPNTPHTVELYASATCDPSGFGEGETSLGTLSVTTDAGGLAQFTFDLAGDYRGSVFTALATDSRGTSEFSACLGPAGAVEVPTLSTWMLLLLATGLAGLGLTVLARPRQ